MAVYINSLRRLEIFSDSGTPLSSIVDVQTDYRFLVTGNYISFYRRQDDNVYIIRILYNRRDYMKILFGTPQADDD